MFLCDCGDWVRCNSLSSVTCGRCSAEFCRDCESLLHHKCTKASAIAHRILVEDAPSECNADDDSDLEVARMALEDAHEVEQEAEDQIRFLSQGFLLWGRCGYAR